MSVNNPTLALFSRILKDIRVELSDAFDQNFERKAFFTEAWARRRSPTRPSSAPLLLDSGALRRSITATTTETSITFASTLPYAGIHNEGGDIVVTRRMKRFFWAKYYEVTGGIAKRSNGHLRQTARNRTLSDKAEFWKHMALMREGSTIRIPRRQFLGMHPMIEATLRDIIQENLDQYFDHEYNFNTQTL